MQVDLGEPLHDLVQQVRLFEPRDVLLELEAFEHRLHHRVERVEVRLQVLCDVGGVREQRGEVELRGVVEPVPARAKEQLVARGLGGLLVLAGAGADGLARRSEHAVEPSQDREREDHLAVLVRLVGPPHPLGVLPEEVRDLAEAPNVRPMEVLGAVVAIAAGLYPARAAAADHETRHLHGAGDDFPQEGGVERLHVPFFRGVASGGHADRRLFQPGPRRRVTPAADRRISEGCRSHTARFPIRSRWTSPAGAPSANSRDVRRGTLSDFDSSRTSFSISGTPVDSFGRPVQSP
jgi:hypothetical protein